MGNRWGRCAHFGKDGRRISKGVAPGPLKGPESEAREETPRGISCGLMLLLELLLMLELDLLLVAQLSF